MIPNMTETQPGIFTTEPITLEMIKKGIDRDFTSYNELLDILIKSGYHHYGWLNSGIKTPECNFVNVYSNQSGSSCLYANHELMVMYSVDMGD